MAKIPIAFDDVSISTGEAHAQRVETEHRVFTSAKTIFQEASEHRRAQARHWLKGELVANGRIVHTLMEHLYLASSTRPRRKSFIQKLAPWSKDIHVMIVILARSDGLIVYTTDMYLTDKVAITRYCDVGELNGLTLKTINAAFANLKA